MGTRSWSSVITYLVGDSIYVKASYFDNPKELIRYSDHFEHKGETLLKGIVLSKHQKSVRVQFEIDDTIATVKFKDVVKVTEENDYLVHQIGKKKIFMFLSTCLSYPLLYMFSFFFRLVASWGGGELFFKNKN